MKKLTTIIVLVCLFSIITTEKANQETIEEELIVLRNEIEILTESINDIEIVEITEITEIIEVIDPR